MMFSRLMPVAVLITLYLLPGSRPNLPASHPQSSTPVAPAKTAIEQNRIGVECMNQNDYKEAAAAFRKAQSEDPSFNLARVNLGIALFYSQDLNGAMAVLKEAEKVEPRNSYVQFVLGLIHRNRGEAGDAIERFSRVAAIDEQCAAAHYNLGLLYSHQHRDVEAESELRRTLALDPDHTGALYNLGGFLMKSGRNDEGARLLDRFRVLSQQDRPSSGMGSGPQYGKMGRYAIAMDYQPPRASPPDPVGP